MANLKFVSYSGEWPTLCSGTLKFRLDGKLYTMGGAFFLQSGGRASFDDNWEPHVTKGPWSLPKTISEKLEPYRKEIETMINENVPWGCCGGCI